MSQMRETQQVQAKTKKERLSFCLDMLLKIGFLVVLSACVLMLLNPFQAQAAPSDRSVKLSSLVTPAKIKKFSKAPSLFGSKEIRSNDVKPFTKWTSVLNRYERQMRGVEGASYRAWFDRLSHLQDADIHTKMRQVNNIVNLNRYVVDQQGWGQSDHWATPVEFIARRSGDCEDFAITKFMTLKALGVPESAMRIAVVQDTIKQIPHAILIVYTGGQSYVLDNQIKQVVSTTTVSHYKPVYSISRYAWWRHSDTTTNVASAAR